MQGHDTSAIRVDGLVKRYPGDVTALDGLVVQRRGGTVFGLLGPNGAGKSTTVKVLTTLSRPDDGRAVVAGIDVLRDPERVRHVIGTVGQAIAVDPDASGRENLELAGRIHGLGGTALKQRVDELLAHFGLTEAADRMARTYSGGMRRKLDVATGLIHRPLILFLDEPTTGLDPEARGELWAEIGRLTREDGLTILLTTHYLDEADRLASRLAIVDRGRIVATGSPEELKAELRGDAIVVELADGSGTTGRSTPSRACRASASRWSTVVRCVLVPSAAQRRCRPSSRRSRAQGSASRRSPSAARLSTTCTSDTPAGHTGQTEESFA